MFFEIMAKAFDVVIIAFGIACVLFFLAITTLELIHHYKKRNVKEVCICAIVNVATICSGICAVVA